ncbi:MAG: DNA-processing protein DprA [Oscillospiraceae bacterium]|nr:DNA-processing protein DprA [Oscillospiraceae bacterium]
MKNTKKSSKNPQNNHELKKYYIWLLSVMGVANPRSMRLISHFGGVKEAYNALTSGDVPTDFLKPSEQKSLKSPNSTLDKAVELIGWCEKRGYGIVTFEDDDYPEPLKHIFNPPILLFTDGEIAGIADEIRINVIGTRTPSEYSYKVASVICGELAKIGFTIVSGMAVGLDKCSMTAALENSGRVVGVLACGIDVDYPRNSKGFRKVIVDSGGVNVSELMPRDSTRPAYFQYRNRIMSGLSSGTLIVEAGERSGCHITALHAISQNRDLFCVPPTDILNPRYTGVARYLRDGAIPVFSHIDIVNEYLSDVCERLSDYSGSATPRVFEKLEPKAAIAEAEAVKKAVRAEKAESKKSKLAEKSVKSEKAEKPVKSKVVKTSVNPEKPVLEFKNKPPLPQMPPINDYSELPEKQAKIVEALQDSPLTFDEIVSPKPPQKPLCEPDEAHEILLDMELDGLISKIAGGRYVLAVR